MLPPSQVSKQRETTAYVLTSVSQFIAGVIGTSQATTFEGLMAARTIMSFGSGVCEAIPVQVVNDIFFIHERGKRIGIYTGKRETTINELCGAPWT
jgi:predicted MFS family arabinose efflux permease